jgi:hypothetical protein
MALVYAAITESCTFRLDERGVCREISASADVSEAALAIANRCIGAQYVASLDASIEGLLAPLPKEGTRLLFARTEDDGRIVLVRSGPLVRFDEIDASAEDADDVTLRPSTPAPSFSPSFGNQAEEISDEAPRTRTFQEEETAPFSRTRDTYPSPEELAAVTRRSPSTVRGFPPPPAVLSATPDERARLRNPDRIA